MSKASEFAKSLPGSFQNGYVTAWVEPVPPSGSATIKLYARDDKVVVIGGDIALALGLWLVKTFGEPASTCRHVWRGDEEGCRKCGIRIGDVETGPIGGV